MSRAVRTGLWLVLLCYLAIPAWAAKPATRGLFTDRSGTIHRWRIDDAHTLYWDDAPYVPVGGMFASKYLESPTEETWKADISALEVIKSNGILDLYLLAPNGITRVPPAALQKLIDYLDAAGFRYGLSINDRPANPLVGYVVSPDTYRIGDIAMSGTQTVQVSAARSIAYALISSALSRVVEAGRVPVREGRASVPVSVREGRSYTLLFLPEKTASRASGEPLPDVWDGFDEYRDRLVRYLSQVRFGPGFRFYLDPFGRKLAIKSESARLLPTGPIFRMQYENWLRTRYRTVGQLNFAWGLRGRGASTFENATQMIPFWYGNRGQAAVYDPARSLYLNADVGNSRLWSDFQEFRDRSIREAMSLMSDILKSTVADVPVVYSWSQHSSIFSNPTESGYDGLGIEAYGSGKSLVTDAAAYTFAQAEEAGKTLWCVVTGTQTSEDPKKSQLGFASREAMAEHLRWLRDMGAKGFFLFGLQLLPEDTWKSYALTGDPKQLGWLSGFKRELESDAGFAAYRPRVFFFPTNLFPPSRISEIRPGVWWVPTLRRGVRLDLGDQMSGYLIQEQDGPRAYLWSNGETQKIDIPITKGQEVQAFGPDGTPIPVGKRPRLTLEVGPEPVQIKGLAAEDVFPMQIAASAMSEFERLLKVAQARRLEVKPFEDTLKGVKTLYKFNEGTAAIIYGSIKTPLQILRSALTPFLWMEGEQPTSHTFDEVALNEGCSNGAYLKLFNQDAPGDEGYSATYEFSLGTEAEYTLWLAGSPQNSPEYSPFLWSIDNAAWQGVADTAPTQSYGQGFAWTRVGAAQLTRGKHTLRLRIAQSRAQPSPAWAASIDALVLSRSPFNPDGIKKPGVD
ncbi:MAG: hypothetical protein IT210_02430 [Armatimonadetes bacterium]|nr:hypothetical protein [Armatimonadota bacterium]